jgi:protein phosphatase
MIRTCSAAYSDVGLVRAKNEDVYWCDPNRGIFIIADGVGAMKGGETAASIAAETVSAQLSQALDQGYSDDQLADALHDAFRQASEVIYDRAQKSEELEGMACSLIAAVLLPDCCFIAHVGDARAYLFSEDSLHQITVDDTPVAAMVKRGYLLPEKARFHNLKNFLVKSIGSEANVEANLTRLPLKPNERLLLCSDGLWAMLDKDQILETLRNQADPDYATRQLVELARQNGGQDNITVIIAHLDSSDTFLPGDTTEEMPPTRI